MPSIKKGTRLLLTDGRSAVVYRNYKNRIVIVSDGSESSITEVDIAEVLRKYCERCRTDITPRYERFCTSCQKLILQELKQAGYLTKGPMSPGWGGPPRGPNSREDQEETKHGMLKLGNDFDSKDWNDDAV